MAAEGSISTPNEENLVEDLMTKLKQYAEQFKKCEEELRNEENDVEAALSAIEKNEDLMHNLAEFVKENTEAQRRETLIEVFKKKEDPLAAAEELIGCFTNYAKNCKGAEIEEFNREPECTLDDLVDKLAEFAQLVIDLKD